MRTRLTLRPGQRGTRRLCDEYGDRLVCVRYRYDEARGVRLKTVELVVDERPWRYCLPWHLEPSNRMVLVDGRFIERALRRELQAAGGAWRPEHGAWEVPYAVAERFGIHGLVLLEETPKSQGRGTWKVKRAAASPKHLPPDAAARASGSTHRKST